MTILIILFIIPCIISTLCNLIKNEIQKKQRRRAQLERERAIAERERLRQERMQEKYEEQMRKAEYKQLKAEQNRDSTLAAIEQNQQLYSMIEKRMQGNISESQRISYQRQLMAIDDRICRLNNKLMDIEYQLA